MRELEENSYDDIIHLPHHVSDTHPHMSLSDRAAQFAPFAALTGHADAVKEAGRLTTARIELDENSKEILDAKLQLLQKELMKSSVSACDNQNYEPECEMLYVVLTYFQKDISKEGGTYVTVEGTVKKIDEYEHVIIMEDGTRIAIDDLVELKGDCTMLHW